MVHVPPDVVEHIVLPVNGTKGKKNAHRAAPGDSSIQLTLKYYLFRLAALLLPLIPPRPGRWVASAFGDLAWATQKKTRETVEANLRQVLGSQASSAEIARLAHNVFRHAAMNYYDLFLIPRLSHADLHKIVVAEGMEHIYDALKEGNGVVAVAPHLGSFDLVAQMGQLLLLDVTIPVERIKPKKLFDLISSTRAANGIRLVPVGSGALKEVQRALLERNGLVAIAADRDVTRSGIPVRFFGRETTVPDAPAFLAWRYRTPVVTACGERKPDGSYVLHVGPRVALRNTGNARSDIQANSQLITEALEKLIRSYPDQWVVFESIWDRPTG